MTTWTDPIPDPPRQACATPECDSVSMRAAREMDGLCGTYAWLASRGQVRAVLGALSGTREADTEAVDADG